MHCNPCSPDGPFFNQRVEIFLNFIGRVIAIDQSEIPPFAASIEPFNQGRNNFQEVPYQHLNVLQVLATAFQGRVNIDHINLLGVLGK